jgi:hypothetical protein
LVPGTALGERPWARSAGRQPGREAGTGGSIFGFGEDEDGELYLLQGGDVLRFESASDCVLGAIFSDGFESGDTSRWTLPMP